MVVRTERAQRMKKLYEEKGWLPAATLAARDDPDHRALRNLFDKTFRAGEKFDRSRAQELLTEKTAALTTRSPEVLAALAEGLTHEDVAARAQVCAEPIYLSAPFITAPRPKA